MIYNLAPCLFLAGLALAIKVDKDPSISAFKKVGSLIDGVAHAHVVLHVNISAEVLIVDNLSNMVQKLASNSSVPFIWMGLCHDLYPLQRQWRELQGTRFAAAPRQPRQVFVAGVLAGTAIVSAGAGLWALHETSVLQQRMDDQDSRVKKLAVSLRSSLHLEHQVVSELGEVKSAVKDTENSVGEIVDFMNIARISRSLLSRMRRRFEAVEAALSHQLHRGLLDSQQRADIYSKLRHRVYHAGYQLVRDGEDQLYQTRISFAINKDELILYSHVPIFPRSGEFQMDLYQHLPLPVRRNGSVVTVATTATHLAMDARGELFLELTPADLSGCSQDGQDWACSTVFPRLRGGARSCLTALFLQHADTVEARCAAVTVVEDDRWFHLNATAFIAVSKIERMIQVNCGGLQSTVGVLGLNVVNIGEGCVATSDLFCFTAVVGHLPSDLHVVVRVPSLKYTELEVKFNKFKNNSDSANPILKGLRDLEDEVDYEIDAMPDHTDAWGVSHTLIVVVVVLILLCGLYYCCTQTQWRRRGLACVHRLRKASQVNPTNDTGGVSYSAASQNSGSESESEMAIIHARLFPEGQLSSPVRPFADYQRKGSLVSLPGPIAGVRRRSSESARERREVRAMGRLDESYVPKAKHAKKGRRKEVVEMVEIGAP